MGEDFEVFQYITTELEKKEYKLSFLNEVLLDIIGGVSLIDLDNTYVEVNEQYAFTCGYAPSELIGENWTKTVFGEDIDKAKDCYNEMIEKGKSKLVFRGKRKTGIYSQNQSY